MRLFSIRSLVLVAVLMACCFVGGLFWLSHYLRQDEAPLDYSRMDVRKGTVDASVNGYTLIREFSETYSGALSGALDELLGQPRGMWDLVYMQELMEDNRELLEVFEDAFSRPEFYFDQENTPDVIMTEVRTFGRYASLRVLEARIALVEGADEQSLGILLSLCDDIETYAKSGGGIISGVAALGARFRTYTAISEVLAESDITSESLKEAARNFEDTTPISIGFQVNLKHEFQFAKNSIQLLAEDPYQVLVLLNDDSGSEPPAFAKSTYRFVINHIYEPNTTTNEFYGVCLEAISEFSQNAECRNFTRYSELNAEIEGNGITLFAKNSMGLAVTAILLPALDVVADQVDLFEVNLRAIQLSLASKAYYQDNGELPEQLSALIPDYMTEIPSDPFDGQPMRYSKDKALIYSVGNDYADSGGSELPFRHKIKGGLNEDSAERDKSEPTFPLRFAL